MTKEEIIEMAKQTGLAIGVALDGSKSVGKHEDKSFSVGRLPLDDFVAFAKLIAEKERGALEVELLKMKQGVASKSDYIQGRWDLIGEFQDIIRARNKT